MKLFLELSTQIDVLLEGVKNEALSNEDVQLVIQLIIVAIVIHLTFSTIVLVYIGVSCYVMIYKQKVFSKEYAASQGKPYYKDQEIADKFIKSKE